MSALPTADARLHVVLHQPEIPPNTGNIGRTCVALGATLWIIEPTGFDFAEKRFRRAGMDYWRQLDWHLAPDWATLRRRLEGRRFWFLTKFAHRSVFDADFAAGDVLVFGNESSGLPPEVVAEAGDRAIRIPMVDGVRCLNLATAAAVTMYEHFRQVDEVSNRGGDSLL